MNNVILVGRLTRNPELRTVNTMNGTNTTCSFTIAVSRQFSNQNGEREADFINCVVWGKQADNLCKYCTKGSQIGVQGRIQTRNYQNDEGKTIYVTEILISSITFLNTKTANQMETNTNHIETNDVEVDPFKDFGNEIVLTDDMLPF